MPAVLQKIKDKKVLLLPIRHMLFVVKPHKHVRRGKSNWMTRSCWRVLAAASIRCREFFSMCMYHGISFHTTSVVTNRSRVSIETDAHNMQIELAVKQFCRWVWRKLYILVLFRHIIKKQIRKFSALLHCAQYKHFWQISLATKKSLRWMSLNERMWGGAKLNECVCACVTHILQWSAASFSSALDM